MSKSNINLNCDLGEGLNNEAELMPYLSSCNIACGGHAGNEATMRQIVKLAKSHSVKIGAHPSFPDKANFGRQIMKIDAADLKASLILQIQSLLDIVHSENTEMHHIKPHGALYNLAAKDEATAKIILQVIQSFGLNLKLYAPYKSVIAEWAVALKVEVVNEAFADRNYNDDLSLVSRSNFNALIKSKEAVFEHVNHIMTTGKVSTTNRVEVALKADTFCVHGDHKNAKEILRYLNAKFQ